VGARQGWGEGEESLCKRDSGQRGGGGGAGGAGGGTENSGKVSFIHVLKSPLYGDIIYMFSKVFCFLNPYICVLKKSSAYVLESPLCSDIIYSIEKKKSSIQKKVLYTKKNS
jgi:hypothetical protein